MNWLARIKQYIDVVCPTWQARWAVYLLLCLGAMLLGGALFSLISCGATYKNAAKVETNWFGWVKEVEGGSTEHHGPSWFTDASEFFGSLTWLLVVGGLLFVYLCFKFPSLVQRFRLRRQAKAALRGDR